MGTPSSLVGRSQTDSPSISLVHPVCATGASKSRRQGASSKAEEQQAAASSDSVTPEFTVSFDDRGAFLNGFTGRPERNWRPNRLSVFACNSEFGLCSRWGTEELSTFNVDCRQILIEPNLNLDLSAVRGKGNCGCQRRGCERKGKQKRSGDRASMSSRVSDR